MNQRDRVAQGRQPTPSLVCVDSQSVKLAPLLSEQRGLDAAKKVNGRKRQIIVDTGGRLWNVYVHAANQADSQAGVNVLKGIESWSQRLQKVLTDSAYEGLFADVVKQQQLLFEVSSKPFWIKGFVPLRKRWVVERTFAWLNHFRRVTKDYEQTTASAEAWILWANCALMLNRLAK
ncbi:transposase [Larkinella punicea]|uniref:transposase n=1 Tax=Larkinella punicea TaxID=2315727 RepID=UPI001E556F9E|nr:transposase [Larkinella punicea]